ncbi:hypothetical protein ACIBL3_03460 [Kribbella sp. NPDC050124]|uniref:hypothetical protein n=1 Tax=Kribbella sp. NPDC050124 TaxID=3364114 RepID=UPI003799B336
MIRRVMAALFAAPLVGLFLTVMPTAQAAPTTTITAVELGRPTVAVSGLNLAPVTVTVRAKYSGEPSDAGTLFVILERQGGTAWPRYLWSSLLPLKSGTPADGVWEGPVYVPSTANGTFKVTGVQFGQYPFPGDFSEPTPYSGPTLAVSGYHLPKITAAVSPRIVPLGSPYSITWAVTDSATGKPYGSRITVLLAIDNGCVEDAGGDIVRTGTNGLVTKAYTAADAQWVNCLRITGKPTDIKGLGLGVARSTYVTAAPSKTSAPVGTVVPVNGSVGGAPSNCKVWLQRLYGATQWRSVSSNAVRLSGRFTVNAQPAYKGLIPYRVYFPACQNFQSVVSKVFYIRGL